jgi:hypothetical protein
MGSHTIRASHEKGKEEVWGKYTVIPSFKVSLSYSTCIFFRVSSTRTVVSYKEKRYEMGHDPIDPEAMRTYMAVTKPSRSAPFI